MATLRQFFGDAISSGQSKYLTDPSKLPIHQVRSSNSIHAKHASNGWHDSSGTMSFWNMVWHVCDQINLTATDEGNWVTATDYTGSGFFQNILTPSSNVAGAEVHMRVTIDGSAYTKKMQLIGPGTAKSDIETNPGAANVYMRGVWGKIPHLGTTGGDGSHGDGTHAYYDQGFSNYTGDIIGLGPDKYGVYGSSGHAGYITPFDYPRFNFPQVRFENSLKVEIKVINGVYTGYYPQGAVSWMRDSETII